MERIKLESQPHCPTCDKLLDGAPVLEDGKKPRPGDVSFCAYCHEILQFTDDMKLRVADPDIAADAASLLSPAMQANRDNEFSRLDRCRKEINQALEKYNICGMLVLLDVNEDDIKSSTARNLVPMKNLMEKQEADNVSGKSIVASQFVIWQIMIKKLESLLEEMREDDLPGQFLKETTPKLYQSIMDKLSKGGKKIK